jgi:hydroxymethylglutaryl-CoA lyase
MFCGYEEGVRTFDVCACGLGGWSFIRGASGNVPTEDAVNLFESMDITTGISLDRLIEAVAFLEDLLCRPLPGRMKRVLDYRRSCAE